MWLTPTAVPIMREHHLSVMSLEEYEPNPEFVGRNFNAGEVIQLVLKARSGHWLPFNYVQMVMMHELVLATRQQPVSPVILTCHGRLAHCKQMNHSRAFWAVRNQYAEQMKVLWNRGFTGEGLWGRGALLATGEFEMNTVEPGELLPEHLCGGTYRSRGRKRKAKPTLTYKEQKERRILKKFGANGVALGEDAVAKKKLEGKKVAAKPRVAGSARGRELRAAAALARFEVQKTEKPKEEPVVKEEEGSETDSGDDYEDDLSLGPDAVDINGTKLLDSKGRGMIKVCEDENPDDQDAQDELRELRSFGSQKPVPEPSGRGPSKKHAPKPPSAAIKQEIGGSTPPSTAIKEEIAESKPTKEVLKDLPPPPRSNSRGPKSCPFCTFDNEPGATKCDICANAI